MAGITSYDMNESLEIFGFTVLDSYVAVSFAFQLNIASFFVFFSAYAYMYPKALCIVKARLYADVERTDQLPFAKDLAKDDVTMEYFSDSEESESESKRMISNVRQHSFTQSSVIFFRAAFLIVRISSGLKESFEVYGNHRFYFLIFYS